MAMLSSIDAVFRAGGDLERHGHCAWHMTSLATFDIAKGMVAIQARPGALQTVFSIGIGVAIPCWYW